MPWTVGCSLYRDQVLSSFEFGTKPCYFVGRVAGHVGVLVALSPTHPGELVALTVVSVEAVRVN